MIRLLNVYFPARTVLLGVSEVALVCIAFTMAVIARFGRDADLVLEDEHGIYKIALVACIYLLSMYYLDLYDTKVLRNRHEILTRLLQVVGLGGVILAIVYYLYPDAQLGRSVLLIGLGVAAPLLVLWREAFLWMLNSFDFSEKTLIVGHSPLALALNREIRTRRELGLDTVGYVDTADGGWTISGLPFLGVLEELADLITRHRVTRVIVAMADRRGKLPLDQLLSLKTKGLVVEDGADLYENVTGKIQLDALRPAWLLFSPGFRVSRALLAYKRALSLSVSLICLIAFSPLLVIVAIAVKLDSKGPAIYRQRRVGKDGKLFFLYKFRTMFDGADANGNHPPAVENDERFTRIGRWLRRVRIDELPQLYNILRGDMDFVGPRPFVPDQEKEYARTIPFYAQRWTVKPGATGWAQINYGYCATLADNQEKTAYDLFYIKHISIGLDLLIIFQTIKILVLGRGGR
ncbi:MAG: TIGR03013 family XrtA/PEP-CTERM system glycosyltransferase [Candidatus Sulfotelmatobacter sp.]